MANQALPDKNYDLISVVYHASQAVETCEVYRSDAEEAGDKEAADLFREVQEQNRRLAEKGAQLLQSRLTH